MKALKIIIVTVVLLFSLSQVAFVRAGAWDEIKETGKKFGRSLKKDSQKAGEAAKKTGKNTKKETKKAYKDSKKALKEVAD